MQGWISGRAGAALIGSSVLYDSFKCDRVCLLVAWLAGLVVGADHQPVLGPQILGSRVQWSRSGWNQQYGLCRS